jgi:uncharacterized protein with HEPN domain
MKRDHRDFVDDMYPSIPWKNIMGMRNKLIHEYFGVDVSMVWETTRTDLMPLKSLIAEMRTRESGQSGIIR